MNGRVRPLCTRGQDRTTDDVVGVAPHGLAVRVVVMMANESQQPTGTGSVTVSLHPLVIMNVSDHFTRCRVQEGGGAVVGIKGTHGN